MTPRKHRVLAALTRAGRSRLHRDFSIFRLGLILLKDASGATDDSDRVKYDSHSSVLLILAVAAVVTLAYFMLRRKSKTADDLERERREWLDRIGRITDGTVIDVQEMPANNRSATFLIYHYDVAGVSYEASQDVTYLRQLINLHSCRLGLPTSVRFDPQNPGNSIVLSERWMGLRQ